MANAADVNDPDVLADICNRLSAGETTRKVTQSYGATFEKQFWKKMAADATFSATISRAREAGQDALTAETIDIADEATEENVQSARLRIWARQWYASKLAPKKYGDRLQHANSAGDGDPVVTIKLESPLPPIKTDA